MLTPPASEPRPVLVGDIPLDQTRVSDEWEDHNGHMNIEHYFTFVHRALARASERWGYSQEGRVRTRHGLFTAEQRLRYLRETMTGESVSVHGLLLERNPKAIRGVGILVDDHHRSIRFLLEFIAVNVDLDQRTSAPFALTTARTIDDLIARHARGAGALSHLTRLSLAESPSHSTPGAAGT